MALDASQLLGSQQLAGVKVSPKGFTKSVAAGSAGVGVGGLVGGAISATAGMKAERRQAQMASETPKFGRAAYLAVTGDELALIKLKSGLVSFKLDEVIERVPRSEVASAELGRVVKKHARAVVQVLGG
jgi:hypothetical protein